jgi:hypothetical protein
MEDGGESTNHARLRKAESTASSPIEEVRSNIAKNIRSRRTFGLRRTNEPISWWKGMIEKMINFPAWTEAVGQRLQSRRGFITVSHALGASSTVVGVGL